MIIGALQVKLFIPEAQSLKEKRFVLKSILTRIRSRFNVSVSEIDGQVLWQSSLIGVVAVGNEQRHVNEVLSKVTDFLREGRNFEVIDSKLEFL